MAALIFLDQTILPVALPTIGREFGVTRTALEWSVNSYLLAIAIFVLISGKLGDRFGHRKTLAVGMSAFVLSSILCGLSQGIWTLVAYRALQGAAAALMLPSNNALLPYIFPPEQRGRALGWLVSAGALFMVLGPLIGGYLTENFSWRWIFYVNVPIGAIGLWMILSFLPSTDRGQGKIDFLGFGYFAVGLFFLTVLFMELSEWSRHSFTPWLCLGLAILALILLFQREKTSPHPFLDLSLFRRPLYGALNISISTTQFILMIAVFRAIYLQTVLGYSPSQAGVITFISATPTLFIGAVAGFLSDRFTPKLPIAMGYLCIIASFFWLGFSPTPSLIPLISSFFLFGLGIPLILTPSFSSVFASVPQQKHGIGFGMIFTLRMASGTLGLALIHLLMSTIRDKDLSFENFRQASIDSFSFVHFTLGFLMIFTFAVVFILKMRKPTSHPSNAPAEGWD